MLHADDVSAEGSAKGPIIPTNQSVSSRIPC